MQDLRIDFDSPHIVHLNASNEIGFGEASKGYHNGLPILGTFPNFDQAAAYCKALGEHIPTKKAAWLIWHDAPIRREDGMVFHQTREELMIPEDLTVDEMKAIFQAVLDVKYEPGKWRFQYWLGWVCDKSKPCYSYQKNANLLPLK